MVFRLYPNPTAPRAGAVAESVRALLAARGQQVIGVSDPGKADVLVPVGGDGTVLRAVRASWPECPPVWAINAGHVGYLTECEPEQVSRSLDLLLAGKYRIERRVVLEGELETDRIRRFFALNEITVHRAARLYCLRLRLSVDDKPILRFAGDGMLIATPTGSTAYNLSCGGPVLLPEADEMAITPICPQGFARIPLVVPGGSRIRLEAEPSPNFSEGVPALVIDGAVSMPFEKGTVTCSRANGSIGFIRTFDQSFYERLQSRFARSREV